MPEHFTDVVTLVIVALVMLWSLPIRGAPYRLAGSRDAVRSIRTRRWMRPRAVRKELRGVRERDTRCCTTRVSREAQRPTVN
jgi:hypothetical protein